jgi:hypothetical protein
MITFLKELFKLIGMLFSSKPSDFDSLELLHMKYFPFSGYKYMCWCGRLIYKDEDDLEYDMTHNQTRWKIDKNHEEIHLRKSKDYKFWIGYYLNYVWEWIKGNPFFKSAYYTNPHEMEAYANEENLDYLLTYDSNNINKYKLSHRRKKWKEVGGTSYKWKQFIKTL